MSSELKLRQELEVTQSLSTQLDEMTDITRMLQEKLESAVKNGDVVKRMAHGCETEMRDVGGKLDKVQKMLDKSQNDLLGERQRHKATMQEGDEQKLLNIEL